MPPNPALRIAILINSTRIPEWQYQMLKKIQLSGDGIIVLAVVRGKTDQSTVVPVKSSLALSLFSRYIIWDRKKFSQPPDPFAERTLDDLEGSIATLTLTPETTRWDDSLSLNDIDTLLEHRADIIIRLGWRILKGRLLELPRYGVWSYHHGDNQVNRGGPPGVWERYHGQICAGVTLQVLSEKLDDGFVLDRSFTATDKSSIKKTRDKLYWRSVDMLPRKLSELRQTGFDALKERARSIGPPLSFYSQPLLSEKKMSLKHVLHYIGLGLYAYGKQVVFSRRFEEKWVLYFRLGDEMSTSIWQFTKIESPNDRYWADPFVIKREGIYYVFVEEYLYSMRRGRIAVIPVSEEGTVGEVKTVLEPDYHLSYPFLFEHDGQMYMIPESGENRTIDLYKCVSFPDQWVHVRTLMKDIYAVDTTLYEQEGRWWMFTNLRDTDGGNTHDELHLLSADYFMDDEWTPHPQRVVVSDVRCARPAGALFKKNGRLFRPAQDCSVDYGFALQLQEITQLSEEHYQETPVSRITPDWNNQVRGVHTFNHADGMTIVDAKTYIKKSDVI